MDKAPDAFRTISEVAEELDVPQHVLRFWETRFPQIRPMKRAGGRRYYRPDDVALVRGIRHLLYGEGYTIRGVQRILRDQGTRFVQTVWQAGTEGQLAAEPDEPAVAEASEGLIPLAREARGLFPWLPSRSEREQNRQRGTPDGTRQAHSETSPKAGIDSQDRDDVPGESMGDSDAERLHAALRDLVECRRLLETVLASNG
jgi:DNA-binding transcriptional MerR regulator